MKSLVLAVHLEHLNQPTTSCPSTWWGAYVSLWVEILEECVLSLNIQLGTAVWFQTHSKGLPVCIISSWALSGSRAMIFVIVFYSYWHTHFEQRAEFGMLAAIYNSDNDVCLTGSWGGPSYNRRRVNKCLVICLCGNSGCWMFLIRVIGQRGQGIGARDFFPLACIVPDKKSDFRLCI